MTVLPKLTLLEKDVLGGIYASNYADTANPNVWSWSIEPLVCTMEQRAGVVSSLNKKGIVTSEGSGDDAAMWVSDTGAAIARELGIYSDGEGYSKTAHTMLVATPAQITRAVDKVLVKEAQKELKTSAKLVSTKTTSKGGPVILSAKEATLLRELLGTAKSINRDYLKYLDKSQFTNPTANYLDRFEAGIQVLQSKGAK